MHDRRHRCSLELRPTGALDAELRVVAGDLEAAGLLQPGASTAARFHPHLTLLRAAQVPAAVVEATAAALSSAVRFDHAATFGAGRIVHVAPTDVSNLHAVRAMALDGLDPRDVDPLAFTRPWTPHLTLAYAVPEPARAAALEVVRAALPITGAWSAVQTWDLDVRPTALVHQQGC